jgi:drug/metabolite transporter (DMT)-like permease
MEYRQKNFLLLHLIVLIWGFTAILGGLISISAIDLVWYRMLIASVGILIFILISKAPLNTSFFSLLKFFGVGILVALHWIFFYEAVKISVSVALACFASGPLFASLIEPLFFKRKIIWYEPVFGALVIVGISIIYLDNAEFSLAVIYSLVGAFLSSLFAVLNGMLIKTHEAKTITFYEMIGGFITMSFAFLFTNRFSEGFFHLSTPDIIYLLILGIICTAFTFVVSVEIMKVITPYTVVLTVNLEPIYGIIMAYFIFHEKMNPGFYAGAGIILVTIFANGILKRYIGK